ncbi:uncharacterized protein LOC136711854 [Amia ocellicauda]|uniref:uncharacterized protein LOC136711854 n=1 Tax=Amia ocellicauda TaxID=2972642 RepID=UPI00346464DA
MHQYLTEFNSQLASVLEDAVKTAICEITKLFEVSLTAFQLEMAQSKAGEYGLKSAGQAAPCVACRGAEVRAAEQEWRRETEDTAEVSCVQSAEGVTELYPVHFKQEGTGLESVLSEEESAAMEELRPEALLTDEGRTGKDSDRRDLQGALRVRETGAVEASDRCDGGETNYIKHQHCEEDWGCSQRQDAELTAAEGNGKINEQLRSEQLNGLQPVHMAEPGPEYITQRHKSAGSEHRREVLNNMIPGNVESVNEILSFIKQEETEVVLNENDAFVSKSYTSLQMKPQCFHNKSHGPSIGTNYTDTQGTLLNDVAYKTEAELQSVKHENTETELDTSQLEQYREDNGSRGQQTEQRIPLQEEMRPCLWRVERQSLQPINQTSSIYSPLAVNKDTAEFTGNPGHCNYCAQCGTSFRTASHLNRHQKIHTGEKPYSCDQCGKSFFRSEKLKDHYRIHTRGRTYGCDQCGKRFLQSGHLRDHYRIHTGERPYSCDQCGKDFLKSGHLKVHYRIHTGEKPFTCTQCEKSFTYSSQLKRHLQIHTGDGHYCSVGGVLLCQDS